MNGKNNNKNKNKKVRIKTDKMGRYSVKLCKHDVNYVRWLKNTNVNVLPIFDFPN
jgi:hypothetical protein